MFCMSIIEAVVCCILAVTVPHTEEIDTSAPAIRDFDLPEFPYAWISRGYEGSFRIMLQIDAAGKVSEVTLLSAKVSAPASRDAVIEELMQKQKLAKWTFARGSRQSGGTGIELLLEYKIGQINNYCPLHPNYDISFGPPIRISITGYKALEEPDWQGIPIKDELASAAPKEADSLMQQGCLIDNFALPLFPSYWVSVPTGSISATLLVDPDGIVTRVMLDKVNLDLNEPNYPQVDILLQKERLLKWTFRRLEPSSYPSHRSIPVELHYNKMIGMNTYCVPPPRYTIHFGTKIEIGITGFYGSVKVANR